MSQHKYASSTCETQSGRCRAVWEGRAEYTCPGGLCKKDLTLNAGGRPVSKKRSIQATQATEAIEAGGKKRTGKRRGAGILAKLFLSEKLAEFMKYTGPLSRGFTTKRVASRAAVNKKMWAYFKKHGLQHKSDGRIIRLNDKLKRLFGTTRHEIHGFKDLPKLLKKHLKM